ncbi:MAG: Rieske (2Fe-2S) protein [Panacagrimonas sp.]
MKHAVCRLSELGVDRNKAFTVEGRSVLLCRTSAGVFAVENKCTHQLATLEGGKMRGVHLFCPKHGARFDLRTGIPNGMTKIPIRTYPVMLTEDSIEIELTEERSA